MLKLSRNHDIYEVWNEWVSESVFVDHKPTKADILELIDKNQWKTIFAPVKTLAQFIRQYIYVERLEHFYTDDRVKFGKNPKTGKAQVIRGTK
jgi:hypothetical protein